MKLGYLCGVSHIYTCIASVFTPRMNTVVIIWKSYYMYFIDVPNKSVEQKAQTAAVIEDN